MKKIQWCTNIYLLGEGKNLRNALNKKLNSINTSKIKPFALISRYYNYINKLIIFYVETAYLFGQ